MGKMIKNRKKEEMKMGKVCHLVTAKNGIPLCKLGCFCEIHNVSCSHRSIAEAKRAVRLLKDKGLILKVVKGHCPAYHFPAAL